MASFYRDLLEAEEAPSWGPFVNVQLAQQGRDHWADPQRTRAGETNSEHGGRGVDLLDPSGHYLEQITRLYL